MSSTEYVNVPRSLEILENQVSEENYKAVKEFINHSAAEGIGESQQQRLVYSLKTLLLKFTEPSFTLRNATEEDLKQAIAELNRSDYAESTKAKFRASIKKFYKIENDGTHPEKVDFFSVHRSRKKSTVSRDDLFTKEELNDLFCNFNNVRDRAYTYVLYESGARPGELLNCSIGDVTSTEKGDFIYLEGLKGTPDRTNQLVRSGRPLREWISQHPFGGEAGNIKDSSAPLWVKIQQQKCKNCGESLKDHDDEVCEYEPDKRDEMNYAAYRRRFKDACEQAEIPENKQRPYNLRHTRLTEVATFMGYEQLNKFAGWKPGSDRAKIYVHLNNDDVNQSIREEYGLETEDSEQAKTACAFCGTENQSVHSECRTCGRPLSLKQETKQDQKQQILERLEELEQEGVLEKLKQLE